MHVWVAYAAERIAVICEISHPVDHETDCHGLAWWNDRLYSKFVDGEAVRYV
jgi:hypothetical protein